MISVASRERGGKVLVASPLQFEEKGKRFVASLLHFEENEENGKVHIPNIMALWGTIGSCVVINKKRAGKDKSSL